MFFKKKENTDAVTKRGIKKMDAIVTTAILGGVVASLYGVKKLKKDHQTEETTEIPSESTQSKKWFFGFFRKK